MVLKHIKKNYPMVQEQLHRLKEYGDSIIQGINSLSQQQPLPDWIPPELNNNLQKVEQAAKKTIELASSPVKIGLMGEFSSGKTLLLGSLIGYADGLPVSETPTTGNVTAIHLDPVQEEDLHKTEFGEFTIKYLSHNEVKECLDYMLQVAAERAQQSSDTLRSFTATNIDINGILGWCKQTWGTTQNKELRSLLRELVGFLLAYRVYGQNICDRFYQVDMATAKDGLRLGDPPMDILQLNFEKLVVSPQPWSNPAKPSAQDLQNSFSLIRRVDVTVKVSKQIWNLSALGETQEFVLLDFPGLGAADSGVRDAFLSLRELKEVQTILLVLNGQRPGGATADKIYTMMEQYRREQDLKDRILVGVGRFNQLPLTVKDKETLEDLAEELALLEEKDVLEELKVLKLTMTGARGLTTQPERVVLLSQMLALKELAKRSTTVEVCSPEFMLELEKYQDDIAPKWEQLSKMLDSSSAGILQRQLSDFVYDGGVGRLRSLIIDHVKAYGLKQLEEDTRRQARVCQQQQNELKAILETIPEYIPTSDSQAFIELRQTIEELYNVYARLRTDLDKKTLQDEISEVVKEEVTNKVFFEWNEWNLLFNNTKNGIVSITVPKGDSVVRDLFGDDEEDGDNQTPTKSEDFEPTFKKSVEELEKFARDRIKVAVTELLTKLSRELEPQRNKLQEILRPEMKQEIREKFGKTEAKLLTTLSRVDDPCQWWKPSILQRSQLEDNSSTIEADRIFPLARADNKHQKCQVFDWDSDKKDRNEKDRIPQKPFNHQILVLRLRNEINNSCLQLQLVEYVGKITKKVNDNLKEILDKVIPDLQQLSKKEALLKYIAADESETKTPSWLQNLSQIASVEVKKRE
ncbi:MAG: dynamin family protein [Cyanobacteriota bacterium]|nr:dynamin family protein [Cyanobacteriota bacterium]